MLVVQKRFLLRAAALSVGALVAAFAGSSGPAAAHRAGIETQTTIPGLVLILSFDIPLSTTSAGLPTGGFAKATLTVANPASVSYTNQPMVVRFGQKPDQILRVNDGTGEVGVIDSTTGAWFHTIAAIAGNSSTVYTITYAKLCTGRWAFAARVGDKVTIQYVQWAGAGDNRCVGDETTNPQPPSFYQLAWPSSVTTTASSIVVASATTTIGPGPTTTSPSGTGSQSTTTFALPPVGATSSTTTTISGSTTSSTLPAASVSSTTSPSTPPTSAVATGISTTTTTLFSPDKTTTSLVNPSPTTSRAPSTTSTKSTISLSVARTTTTAQPTTTVQYCKTVGGARYCGPKSSAYKPGQKKSVELKPGQKAPKSTVTSKKK